MGKKKDTNAALGKSILKTKRFNSGKAKSSGDTWLHTSDMNDGYEWGRLNLNSVTEQSALDEFLTTAELAGTEFTAEKLNIKVIDPQQFTGLPTVEETKAIQDAQQLNKDLLNIPRRPKWDVDTTAEELAQRERDSFLEWRRQLALLQEQEHIVITPFERNLEFWRQLWRVIERSDIIVQIVDARNPLLFRCEDLEKYVKEVNPNKENMILISKADLLTPTQRKIWAKYFSQQHIKVAFWSAVEEQERLKRLEQLEEEGEEEQEDEEDSEEEEEDVDEEINIYNPAAVLEDEVDPDNKSSDDLITQTEQLTLSTSEELSTGASCTPEGSTQTVEQEGSILSVEHAGDSHSTTQQDERTEEKTHDSCNSNCEAVEINTLSNTASMSERTNSEEATMKDERTDCTKEPKTHGASHQVRKKRRDGVIENDPTLLTGEQLLDLLYAMHDGKESVQDGVTTVGMVGYPNVGKSSTINALLQQKKVPVSATPGRTKHFQTLFVEPTMCLCDCPGLVMPSFVSTKAEMVINGILPIDQMRDYMPPISIICQRIPRKVLETIYGINIVKPKEGEDQSRPPTTMEFINAYAYMRGYMTHKGLPDGPRAARIVLKDYVKGKLLYSHVPPGIDTDVFKPVQTVTESKPYVEGADRKYASRPLITAEGTRVRLNAAKKLDEAFFQDCSVKTHSKGAEYVNGFKDYTVHPVDLASRVNMTGSAKPWKKHGNKNSKQKIRRVYQHLDAY